MEMETLQDLYVEGLKDLWSAENQILKALPRMAKAATHSQLSKAFKKHETQTREHVRRLERICKELVIDVVQMFRPCWSRGPIRSLRPPSQCSVLRAAFRLAR